MVGVKIRVWWRECSHKDGKEDGGNSENHKMRNDIFCNALWSDKKPIDGALKPPHPTPPPPPWCHFTQGGLLRPLWNILFTRHNPDGTVNFFFHRLLGVGVWKHHIRVGVMFCKITDWFLWSYCKSAGEMGNWGRWFFFFFFPRQSRAMSSQAN